MPQVVETIALRRPLDQVPDGPAQLPRGQQAGQTGGQEQPQPDADPRQHGQGTDSPALHGNFPLSVGAILAQTILFVNLFLLFFDKIKK